MRRSLALFLILVAPAAFATNGYFTHGTGTLSKAMAGANTALPQESLDSDANPAASVFIPGGYSASLALFSPVRQYAVSGAPSGMPQTFGLTPGTVSSKSEYFPMPSFSYNRRPSAANAFTLNVMARGGMNTDYRTSTFYGRDHTGVDLAQMYVTGTFAHKLNAQHAVGITAILAGQRFKASGLEAFSNFSSEPECLTGNGYDTSYGMGVKFGYLGYLMPNLSVGASLAPRIKMSTFENYCGLFAQEGAFDVPASASLGIAYTFAQPVTLSADWQRIHYGDVRSIGAPLLPNLMTSPLGGENGAGFGWKDINVAKVGIQWKASPVWTWRAGYSKADQPIPQTEVLFNILAPGVIEQHVTFGGSKAISEKGRFNFAFMYAPNKSVAGPNPMEMPGQQRIALKMHEWEAEFGYSFGF